MSTGFAPVELDSDAVVARLAEAGLHRGEPLGLAFSSTGALGLAHAGRSWMVATAEPAAVVAEIEGAVGPRWLWW